MTTTTHILLVEDDPAIATSLKVTFKRENWQLTWLDNASAVIPTLAKLNSAHNEPTTLSAIILDVGLPDGDGLSICQKIRHSSNIGELKDTPILFLTARNEEVDRILGLEMGADDYCAKPFSPRELIARIKAIWRRQAISNQNKLQTPSTTETQQTLFKLDSGEWSFHPSSYQLFWQGKKLELSNTERKLLLFLLNHPKQVFSREQLLSAISEHPDHRLARTIDSHIKAIRKQLSCIEADAEVIYTHRGLGYGLCKS